MMNAEEIRQNIPIFEVAERLGITGNLRAAGDNEMRGPCPLHGGDNRDAFSMYQDSNRWECRTHCGKGSQIDLVMNAQGVDAAGAIRWINEAFQLEAGNGSHPQAASRPQPKAARIEQKEPRPAESDRNERDAENNRQWWIEYADRMHGLVDKTDYFTRRGINRETIERFKLGFDQKRNWAVIPCEQGFCVRRNISGQGARYLNPSTASGIRPTLFNGRALYQGGTLFICEGAINALSILQAGHNAMATNSTGNMGGLLMREISSQKPTAERIIIAADPDEPGTHAAKNLQKALLEKGIESWVEPFGTVDQDGKKKEDANDMLIAGTLATTIEAAIEHAEQAEAERQAEAQAAEKAAADEHEAHTAFNRLSSFREQIKKNKKAGRIPTGFDKLDRLIYGGLAAKFYIIGAIPALGKTAFTLQIADNIAKQGDCDVIIASLEMSAHELMARTLSRLTFEQWYYSSNFYEKTENEKFRKEFEAQQEAELRGKAERKAQVKAVVGTGQGCVKSEPILYDDIRNDWQDEALGKAYAEMEKFGENLFILEGHEQIKIDGKEDGEEISFRTARGLLEAIKRHERIRGKDRKKVLIVDYLQIMQSENDRLTDKQAVDRTISRLKEICIRFNMPVIAISSLNRGNYTTPANMTAFKESGSIEYTAEVLIGMQLSAIRYEPKAAKKNGGEAEKAAHIAASAENPVKDIDIVILKNRSGQAKGVQMQNVSPYYHFEEMDFIKKNKRTKNDESGQKGSEKPGKVKHESYDWGTSK